MWSGNWEKSNSLPFSWVCKLLSSTRSLARPTRLVTAENTSIERCVILETDVRFQTTLFPCIWSMSLSPIKIKFTRFDFFLRISHKKRKDSLEPRAVPLIFLLELEMSGVAVQSTIKRAKMVTFARNCLVKMTLRLF